MKVNPVANYTVMATPSFGRKLKEEEKAPCAKAIQDGLKALDKNLAIILPTNCSPSEESKDVGIGQPYSTSSRNMLMPFLHQWGFNRWQQEPNYLRKPTDPSPYVSNSSAYNTLIIDLEELTKEENGALLSEHTYKDILKNNPKKGGDRTAYYHAVNSNKRALYEAYDNFDHKRRHLEDLTFEERSAILDLDNDFEKFIKENGEKQEKNALYNVLTDLNGNDYWPNWKNEIDRNLFDKPEDDSMKQAQQARLKELRTKRKREIESFMFGQMLAKQTMEKGNAELEKLGIKQSADIPVALSDAEVWGNKSLFSKNLRMGCMEPWSEQPQYWGFRVLDPEQMFNEDGSLGEAGKFLYDKYKRVFTENQGGVRIDHIVGLMDPYVYDEEDNTKGGRLYSELYKGVNGDPEKCDRILKEIVIPAAKEAGLDSSVVIAEDLGYMPHKTKEALDDLGICGINVTQWLDAHEVWHAPANNAAMVGCHDTATAKELYPDKDERRNKFIELFSSGAKNIQVFWTDLLGIEERYNQPGTTGEQNWSLRMTPEFNDTYHKRLEEDDALNIPEAILEANRRRDNHFNRKHHQLSKQLEHWSKVLKEEEK